MQLRPLSVVSLLAIGLVACGGTATSQPADSSQGAASSGAVADSQPATGACRAFLINGPIDLGRQVIAQQSSGENTEDLTRDMLLAYDDVASNLSGDGQDVEDFRALAARVSAGEAWEGALTQFVEAYAEACGVQIVRH